MNTLVMVHTPSLMPSVVMYPKEDPGKLERMSSFGEDENMVIKVLNDLLKKSCATTTVEKEHEIVTQTQIAAKPPALKYELPLSLSEKECYVCTECKERRKENSFFLSHTHPIQKPLIKWYCPICDRLFSTSYRSGHLRKAHKLRPTKTSLPVCKRPRSEKEQQRKRAKLQEDKTFEREVEHTHYGNPDRDECDETSRETSSDSENEISSEISN